MHFFSFSQQLLQAPLRPGTGPWTSPRMCLPSPLLPALADLSGTGCSLYIVFFFVKILSFFNSVISWDDQSARH